MNYFLFDTSALAKRYVPEVGTPLINHLLNTVSKQRMFVLVLAFGELVSLFVRKKNSGQISRMSYLQALADSRSEMTSMVIQSVSDDLVWKSLPLIEQYSINATDAIILRSALNIADTLRVLGHDLVLVTSDIRLVNSAQSSKLVIWNPEKDDQSSLEELISIQ
jgi:predicted nucleic acid-binding protein